MSREFFSSLGNPNAVSMIGDSRTKDFYVDSLASSRVRSSQHPFAWANALLDDRFDVAYNGGISGARSDVYLNTTVNWRGVTTDNLTASLASNALWWTIFGVVNDISYGTTAAQLWNGWGPGAGPSGASNTFIGWNAAIDMAILLGKRVILQTDPGSTGFNATQIGELNKFNRRLIQKARSARNIQVFDRASAVWDATAAGPGITFKTGYSSDGTHLLALGGYRVGVSLANFLDKLIPPRSNGRLTGAGMTKAQGGVNWAPNPLFKTATGGNIFTGVTGAAAAGLDIYRTGTATAVASVVSAASGNGQRVAATFGAAGEEIRIDMALGNTGITVGDIFEAMGRIDIAAGATNLAGVYLKLEYNINGYTGNLETQDMYAAASLGPVSADAVTLGLHTEQAACPPYTTLDALYVRLGIVAAGAGSATVTWSEPMAIKSITQVA